MRIHLTLAFLDGLHGSVLHVREYAAHLMSQGHEVSVSCLYADTETPELFRDSGIPVARVMDVDVSAPYDVLYALHFLSAGALLQQGLETRKLVLASLSGYARLESYPVFWREASLLTVVSEEVRLSHRRKFGVPMDKMLVAENAIPAGFDEAAPPRAEGYPRRVAVVSNHIPQELTEALALLPPEIQTDCIGREVGNSRLVTPELLRDYDLIITIGKTVQYAMGMGIPVFEYDRYGGNGYIRPDNMEAEAAYNFSGRPHKRTLTPQELVQEIETGYENCRRQTSELRVMALQRFSLAAVVQRQLQRLAEIPDFPADYWAPFRRKYALALSQYSFLSRWIGNHRVKKEEADAAVAKLNGRLLLSEKRSAELTLRLKEAEEESAALTFSLRQAEERKAELAVKVKKLANFRKRVLAQPKTEARGVVWRRVQYFDSKVEYYLFGIRILTKQSI